MTHHVQIRITPGAQTDNLTEGTWFKQTTKINGVKTTSVFQRPDKPRDFGQKVIDFFSGIKKAKNSITLCEAFKCINKNTSFAGKFNENLIPAAVEKLRAQPAEDLLDTAKSASTLSVGKYTLSLDE